MPPETDAGMQLTAITGFRLVTGDLPRLRRFYDEVLGFTPEGEAQPIGVDEMAVLGLRGYGLRQVLRLGEQIVGIDQYEEAGRAYPDHGDAASLWFQHLALVVADMAQAYPRIAGAAPISSGGPQLLPASSGGVYAYKFRDPDGHPLELLQLPANARPHHWQGKSATPGQIGLGIDHTAISVADAEASLTFYAALGLSPGHRTLNHGPEQQHLDDLADVQVEVVPMQPEQGTPHLELLVYRAPRGAAGLPLQANDIAATRVVWSGARPGLLRDPDGHLQQIIQPGGAHT